MRQWSVYDAKNHFSEVVNAALHGGAQGITRHGRRVAVLLSLTAYEAILSIAEKGLKLIDAYEEDTEEIPPISPKSPYGPESPITLEEKVQNSLSNAQKAGQTPPSGQIRPL